MSIACIMLPNGAVRLYIRSTESESTRRSLHAPPPRFITLGSAPTLQATFGTTREKRYHKPFKKRLHRGLAQREVNSKLSLFFNMVRREDILKLLPTTDELLPRQFYKTAGTRPKTALGPMLGFATIAYLAVLIAFVLLVIDTSGNYNNEVTIASRDMTGSGGYTCEMISKVTNSYMTNSATDPATSYNLVNIIESKDQCVSNLATTNPCSTSQTYIPGDGVSGDDFKTLYIAVGLYGSDTAYMFDIYGNLANYNYSDGTTTVGGVSDDDDDDNSDGNNNSDGGLSFDASYKCFGIDVYGNMYYIIPHNGACNAVMCVVQATPSFLFRVVAEYNTSFKGIINDNLYNLYLYDQTNLYAVDYLSDVPSQQLLLHLEDSVDMNFENVAVHTVDKDMPSIYFSSSSPYPTSFHQYVDGVMKLLGTMYGCDSCTPLVTNGVYLFFPLTITGYFSAITSLDTRRVDDFSFTPTSLDAPTSYQSIAISVNGTRIFATTTSNDAETMDQYFYYLATQQFEVIAYQYNFGVGWFVCGGQIISPVPARASTYTAECSSNGIVGQVLYQEENRYLFTLTDAIAYAFRNSAPYCPALYDQVCNTVADLPPYSCTKKVYPTVFTVLGTAYANTMFLLSILIFVFSMSLTRMAKYYPPPGTNVHGTGGQKGDTESADVEMGEIRDSTNNPITSASV